MFVRRSDRVGGTATILVTDLVGSTAMFDRLGDDRAERLLRSHLTQLRDLVRSFGGVEVKSTGDGIMAAFPGASLATECAVAMQRVLHLRNEAGVEEPLHIRIGMHSGDTTVDRHDHYGIAVAVAARLCDKASPDEILVSGLTRGLVGSRGGHGFTEAGVPELKGIDEPVRAWTIDWGPGGAPPAPPPGLNASSPLLLIGSAATFLVLVVAGIFFFGRGDADEGRPPVDLSVPGEIVRVSVRSDTGGETEGSSFSPDISGNGRYVVFTSSSDNLVDRDTNQAVADVFHVPVSPELEFESLQIVSRRGRSQGNADSAKPSVSDDGTIVAFLSRSTNLAVKEDANAVQDVFVHEIDAGTSRVSISTDDAAADDRSFDVDVSGDGNYIAFATAAKNLAFGERDTNDADDIFVRDRVAEKTNRVNIRSGTLDEANDDSFGPVLSKDGRYVAFASVANDLTPRDTNNRADVFRYDRSLRKTRRASITSDRELTAGGSSQPSLSDDGDLVAFVSEAVNLADDDTEDLDVFVHDFTSGSTIPVSVGEDGATGEGDSENPAISGDGRFVVFDSKADDLVPFDSNGARDVFLHDLRSGTTVRLSVTEEGEEATDDSFEPAISDDGRYVVFTSRARLVEDDSNSVEDVYLIDLS